MSNTKICKERVQIKGFAHNKGIESLTLGSGGTKMFYLTEEPNVETYIEEDKDSIITLFELNRLTQEENEYIYPINLKFNNGVVAIRSLSNGSHSINGASF